MAKSLHELSPRAQIAVFAILAALAVGVAWRVLLGPMHDELVARRTRLATLQGEVAKAQVVAAKLKAIRQLQVPDRLKRARAAFIIETGRPKSATHRQIRAIASCFHAR